MMIYVDKPLDCILFRKIEVGGDMAQATPHTITLYVCETCVYMLAENELVRVDVNK